MADTNTTNSEGTAGGLGADTVYRLLADGDRRRIITALDNIADDTAHPTVHRETVAARLQAAGGYPHSRAMVLLHHVHLPELAAADVIGYDPTDGEITIVNREALAHLVDINRIV